MISLNYLLLLVLSKYSLINSGLQFTMYTGYFADNVSWFQTATPLVISGTSTGNTSSISSISTGTNNLIAPSTRDNYSVQWIGYFYATITGTWTFFTSSDDASYMWIGSNARTGYTVSNATVNNGGNHGIIEKSGTANLIVGTYYPIRIQFGENAADDNMTFSFTPPGGVKTTNGLNILYAPLVGDNFV